MTADSISPRAAVLVGALALLPVAWYGLGRSVAAGVAIGSSTAGAVAAVNVLIITAALLIATSPAGHGAHHDGASA